MAFATAAPVPVIPISPMPRAARGLSVVSGMSIVDMSMSPKAKGTIKLDWKVRALLLAYVGRRQPGIQDGDAAGLNKSEFDSHSLAT